MPGNLEPSQIAEKYGNRVRIRACGLCWKDNKLLMVNHRFVTKGDFWSPPGGGVEFGQPATEALMREFLEETSIHIVPGNLLFTCEFIQHPLHAIELFFEAVWKEGVPKTGTDPESEPSKQIINKVRFLDFPTIMAIPEEERHGIFRFVKTIEDLKGLRGFYRI